MLRDYKLCIEVGRVLRNNTSIEYKDAVLAKAISHGWISRADYGDITARRPRIGMETCGVIAALGLPNRVNKTVTAMSVRQQFVYESKRRYIYLENDVVTSWQE